MAEQGLSLLGQHPLHGKDLHSGDKMKKPFNDSTPDPRAAPKICGTVSVFGSVRQKEASALSQGNAWAFQGRKQIDPEGATGPRQHVLAGNR